MDYLLKSRVDLEQLPEAIEKSLREQYEINCKISLLGKIVLEDNDALAWFQASVEGEEEEIHRLIAVGYEKDSQNDSKYRIYGNIEKYCPREKITFVNDTEGNYCPRDGYKLVNKLR